MRRRWRRGRRVFHRFVVFLLLLFLLLHVGLVFHSRGCQVFKRLAEKDVYLSNEEGILLDVQVGRARRGDGEVGPRHGMVAPNDLGDVG